MSTTYSFLSWTRRHRGAISAIQQEDEEGATLTAHATFPIQLDVNDRPNGSLDLRLYGPGDIVAIDRRQIIRTEPSDRTNDFPPNYFPAIEFDQPDFPWLFTPAKAESQHGRLRPWLCLVVVRKQEGVTLGPQGKGALPVLTVRHPAVPAHELPDLSESWAWVHSQVIHNGSTLDDTLNAQPNQNGSRLLCPRHLQPHAAYYACLVPAFEVGRKAGLIDEAVTAADEATLQPAWQLDNTPDTIRLPVYYHWEFSTAQEGDFEALAQLLRPNILRSGEGSRKLYVDNPDNHQYTVNFTGVFRPTEFDPPLLPNDRQTLPDAQRNWLDQVEEALNYADNLIQGEVSDPIVGPPIYGRFQQGLQRLSAGASWVNDLNLDVRNRSAAGLGIVFVQAHQEELMHSAWRQLGDIERVQQLTRQNEVAEVVSEATFTKHFLPLQSEQSTLLYQMTSPVHTRVQLGEQTVTDWSQQRQLPAAETLTTFRKVSRPQGPIAQRLQPQEQLTQPLDLQVAQTGADNPQALKVNPLGIILDDIGQQVVHQVRAIDRAAGSRLQAAFADLQTRLEATPPSAPLEPLDAKSFDNPVESLVQQLDPKVTIPRILANRVQQPGTVSDNGDTSDFVPLDASETEPLPPPQTHPVFPQPMYEVIRELMPDLLLPGADAIPNNTVTLLETNPQFIEAFMTGLNHEMARELLWRKFPTDQRGTYFRSFWTEGKIDLEELHLWETSDRLGSHFADGHVAGDLVLVIRGELLRRFPNTVIYAVPAATATTMGGSNLYPVHRGLLSDDTVFLLFKGLTDRQALGQDGSPGWFFVLQEQPTEPRFGLDETSHTATPESWDDLAWPHVSTTPGGYLQVKETAEILTVNAPGGRWGFNGAHMASITFQKPFRVALHAKRLVLPAP